MESNCWEASDTFCGPVGYGNVIKRRPRGELSLNMLEFCNRLRDRGFMVGVAEAADVLRMLQHVDLEDWREFYLVLRSLFVSRFEELTVFDALFHSFWTGWGGNEHTAHQLFEAPQDHAVDRPRRSQAREQHAAGGEAEDEQNTEGNAAIPLFSAEEMLSVRLFGGVGEYELREMEKCIQKIGRNFATRPGRRTHMARKGHIVDLRRSMRRNLGWGGEIVALAHKRRSLRRLRLVLLLDVSRSMDIYSQLLLKLIYSLHSLRGTTESFVFGTGLKRVTACFASTNINVALANLSKQVPFWSGGTRIGYSFSLFNQKYANKVLTSRTVLMVLSDGLDTEQAGVVAEELSSMKQKVRKVIWVNPLADAPGYEPLAASMAAAMPYIDVFTSVTKLLSGSKNIAVQA